MKLNLKKELATLERMTVGELHERYVEVFGEPARISRAASAARSFSFPLANLSNDTLTGPPIGKPARVNLD